MRVSCACPAELASETLVTELEALGIQPIVTSLVVRGVYEGDNHKIGETIVRLFEEEKDHEINVDYTEKEQAKSARKAARKAERAERNARLHGHRR